MVSICFIFANILEKWFSVCKLCTTYFTKQLTSMSSFIIVYFWEKFQIHIFYCLDLRRVATLTLSHLPLCTSRVRGTRRVKWQRLIINYLICKNVAFKPENLKMISLILSTPALIKFMVNIHKGVHLIHKAISKPARHNGSKRGNE